MKSSGPSRVWMVHRGRLLNVTTFLDVRTFLSPPLHGYSSGSIVSKPGVPSPTELLANVPTKQENAFWGEISRQVLELFPGTSKVLAFSVNKEAYCLRATAGSMAEAELGLTAQTSVLYAAAEIDQKLNADPMLFNIVYIADLQKDEICLAFKRDDLLPLRLNLPPGEIIVKKAQKKDLRAIAPVDLSPLEGKLFLKSIAVVPLLGRGGRSAIGSIVLLSDRVDFFGRDTALFENFRKLNLLAENVAAAYREILRATRY